MKLLGPKELAHKNTSILLKGFVYHHKETCFQEECPLKRTISEFEEKNSIEDIKIKRTRNENFVKSSRFRK